MSNSAAVKTYEELRKLCVIEAGGYLQKFSELLKEIKTSIVWDYTDDFGIFEKHGCKLLEFTDAVNCLIQILTSIQSSRKSLMFIGNGGSAGIAMHALADYANAGGFKIADFYNPALLTCMANDYSFENVFAKPIRMFAGSGDTLFAISSSGQSPDILNACKAALDKKCYVITFSGFSPDNPLRKLGYLNFYVPSNHYGFVELAHQTIIHCILDLFVRNKIYEEERKLLG